MFKKVVAILIAVAFLVSPAFAARAGEGVSYKIKRLVKDLYDKPKRMDAQRKLPTYGAKAVEYVTPLLKEKNNEFVQIAALKVLAQTADSSVEDQVIPLLKSRDHRVRQEAAKTLGVIGTEKSVEPLKRVMTDQFPNVRFNAMRSLAKLAPASDTNLFIAALGDYDPRVRVYAVAALGRLKSKEAVPYLTEMVRDYDPGVRMTVAKALALIGTQDCLQPLVWLTKDPDTNIRMVAIERLGTLKVSGVDEFLVEASDSMDPRVSSRAILALGRRKSSKAVAVAKQHLEDEHMSVKLASVRVIGEMGGKSDKSLLEPLLKAESSKVRQMSKVAISEVEKR